MDGVLELGQCDPAFHLAPLHSRLSGEVRERETYSRSRLAVDPFGRSRRRPGRPRARSRIDPTASRVQGAASSDPMIRYRARRTTRVAIGSCSASEAVDVEPELVRRTAHDPLERVRGRGVQFPPILAEEVGRAGDRPLDLAPGAALDRRDDPEADRVAQELGVAVHRVDPGPEVERPAERLDLGPLDVEQRLHQGRPVVSPPPGPDAPHRLEPAAADQVHEDGLDLVVERVTLGDRPRADRAADVVRGVRARDGRPRLDRDAPGRGVLRGSKVERHPEPFGRDVRRTRRPSPNRGGAGDRSGTPRAGSGTGGAGATASRGGRRSRVPPRRTPRTRSPGANISCSRAVLVTRSSTRATAGGRRISLSRPSPPSGSGPRSPRGSAGWPRPATRG